MDWKDERIRSWSGFILRIPFEGNVLFKEINYAVRVANSLSNDILDLHVSRLESEISRIIVKVCHLFRDSTFTTI